MEQKPISFGSPHSTLEHTVIIYIEVVIHTDSFLFYFLSPHTPFCLCVRSAALPCNPTGHDLASLTFPSSCSINSAVLSTFRSHSSKAD